MPIYESWSDNMPIDAVTSKVKNCLSDAVSQGVPSCDLPANSNVKCTSLHPPETITKDWILNNPKYMHLFQGIGQFKCNTVTIEMQSDAVPIRKASRKVPLALRDKFESEIKSMVQAGILTEFKPNMATPQWLNFFVVVKKPNDNLRVCLDLTYLNKHIIHPVYNMYTLDDDLLKDTTHFTVFDSTKSFFHVSLDEAIKQLTAILTPIRIFVFNVLAMGLSNATDIFEHCMRQIVHGLRCVMNIADDILVFGRNRQEFQENVIQCLDRCIQHDFHLKPDKIQIDVDAVPFFGQTLTKARLQINERKWEVIQRQ